MNKKTGKKSLKLSGFLSGFFLHSSSFVVDEGIEWESVIKKSQSKGGKVSEKSHVTRTSKNLIEDSL